MDSADSSDTLFGGATRPAMILGIPLVPAMCAAALIVWAGVVFHMGIWLAVFPVGMVMRAMAKKDDQTFRQLWLRFYCRVIRRNWNARFWKASSYSPLPRKRR